MKRKSWLEFVFLTSAPLIGWPFLLFFMLFPGISINAQTDESTIIAALNDHFANFGNFRVRRKSAFYSGVATPDLENLVNCVEDSAVSGEHKFLRHSRECSRSLGQGIRDRVFFQEKFEFLAKDDAFFSAHTFDYDSPNKSFGPDLLTAHNWRKVSFDDDRVHLSLKSDDLCEIQRQLMPFLSGHFVQIGSKLKDYLKTANIGDQIEVSRTSEEGQWQIKLSYEDNHFSIVFSPSIEICCISRINHQYNADDLQASDTYIFEKGESGSFFATLTSNVFIKSTGKRTVSTFVQEFLEVGNVVTDADFVLPIVIPNGTNVDVFGKDQLDFEWVNEKAEVAYDKGSLAAFQDIAPPTDPHIVPTNSTSIFWIVVAVICVSFSIIAIMRLKGRGALIAAFVLVIPVQTASLQADEHYCGMYCVAGAAAYFEKDIGDFRLLLTEEYISERYGSTILDLQEALARFGLVSTAYAEIGQSGLLAARNPLILHAMSHGQVQRYNHWILFLGLNQDGSARVLEDEKGPVTIPLSILLARWDGVCLEVRSDNQPSQIGKAQNRHYLQWFGLLVACSLLLISTTRINAKSSLIVIFGMALFLFCYSAFAATGALFDSDGGRHYLNSLFLMGKLPRLELQDLEQLYENDPNLIVVDSRYERNAIDMLPRAVNIPVDLSFSELTQATENWRKDQQIVIYCANENCGFSDHLGTLLRARGFYNVSVLREGWSGWKRASLR